MLQRAEIVPHLTSHCPRATSIEVLSDENCEARYIVLVTDHSSVESIKSYKRGPSLKQSKNMSKILTEFIADDINAVLLPSLPIQVSNQGPIAQVPAASTDSRILVQHNQLISAHSATATGTDLANKFFPQPSYTFDNCSVQIHNYYRQQSSS